MISAKNAVNHYAQQVKSFETKQADMGLSVKKADDSAFNEMLQVTNSLMDSLEKGEDLTAKAAAGKANIQEVVEAVSQAEIALNTVTAIRDKVIQAYQEILRMPV